ncbi:hypothetical protein [Carp edema virus]|nr:hypothetical protein [Carp edema virus]
MSKNKLAFNDFFQDQAHLVTIIEIREYSYETIIIFCRTKDISISKKRPIETFVLMLGNNNEEPLLFENTNFYAKKLKPDRLFHNSDFLLMIPNFLFFTNKEYTMDLVDVKKSKFKKCICCSTCIEQYHTKQFEFFKRNLFPISKERIFER